jgi:osmotically-inducible protein OsmY
MRLDHRLQRDVVESLDYDPAINCSHIGVAVRDGIVTLFGHVPSIAEKRAAALSTGQVKGVKAVIDDIVIELPGSCQTSDEIVAERAYSRLTTNRSVPISRIHLEVKDSVVTLRGDVDWQYQRLEAEADLHKLDCISAIRNELTVKPAVKSALVQSKVHDALARLSPLDAENIKIETDGSAVTLTGAVTSWHEKQLAENAVWSVPGVTSVANRVAVV